MNPFEFSIPQNIIVGAGTLAKLPECAKKMGGTHAMILFKYKWMNENLPKIIAE